MRALHVEYVQQLNRGLTKDPLTEKVTSAGAGPLAFDGVHIIQGDSDNLSSFPFAMLWVQSCDNGLIEIWNGHTDEEWEGFLYLLLPRIQLRDIFN